MQKIEWKEKWEFRPDGEFKRCPECLLKAAAHDVSPAFLCVLRQLSQILAGRLNSIRR